MKLAKVFKQVTLDDFRQMLKEAINEDKITYNTDVWTAFQVLLDSLEFVQITMALEEAGLEGHLRSITIRKLLLGPGGIESQIESQEIEMTNGK